MIKNHENELPPHARMRPKDSEWLAATVETKATMPLHLALRRVDHDAPNGDLLLPSERRPRWFMHLWPYLYRYYDADRQPLYIGISSCFAVRLAQHRKTSPWWPLAEYVAISVYATPEAAAEAEKAALRNEKPRFNKQGVRGPAYARLHLHGDAEAAAAQLHAAADPEFVAALAAFLSARERFPQPTPPPDPRRLSETA
ncbi:hypothetical protein [Streptomyces sp. ISL-86]|uniref:hypothetical protein n=1 Tax=Streptomyces sp. ISL-86 TaxID=2819187 RepID=UPI001BE5440B|nr:hypothetical protein [Streptomyces sp. ISL-86]MBT2453314.1 hypothetical protein [Streptomyces sp. ISL-86]